MQHRLIDEAGSALQEFTAFAGTNWTHVRFVVLNRATRDARDIRHGIEPDAEGEDELMHGIAATAGRPDGSSARARPFPFIFQQLRPNDSQPRIRA